MDERPDNRSTTTNPNGQNLGFGITRVDLRPLGRSSRRRRQLGPDARSVPRCAPRRARSCPASRSTTSPSPASRSTTGSAEDGRSGWTFGGFRATTAVGDRSFFNAYVAREPRVRRVRRGAQDRAVQLRLPDTRPDWAEQFPYQDGLLVWYWDTQFTDNNVGDHPGGGLILPVDATPTPLHWANGSVMRPRLQSFDATFTTQATDAITLHERRRRRRSRRGRRAPSSTTARATGSRGDPGRSGEYPQPGRSGTASRCRTPAPRARQEPHVGASCRSR